jgi:hypothetical protein
VEQRSAFRHSPRAAKQPRTRPVVRQRVRSVRRLRRNAPRCSALRFAD